MELFDFFFIFFFYWENFGPDLLVFSMDKIFIWKSSTLVSMSVLISEISLILYVMCGTCYAMIMVLVS